MPGTRRSTDYRIEPFDLQLFTQVIDLGTITAAAKAMNLSLAAASVRIKTLEDRIGVQLLVRSKRGVATTEAGKALARRAQRLLTDLDAVHVEMAAFSQGLRGSVRLLCNTSALAEALPHRIGRFLLSNPDIDLDVQELASDAVLDSLRRGAADVGILADHVDTTGLVTQRWLSDDLVAILPAQRRRRATRTLRYADLLDQPFVGLATTTGLSHFLLQQAARCGRVPQHRVRLGSFDAIASVVEAGVGVAVVPRSAANRWPDARLEVAALQDSWATRWLLICSTEQAATQRATNALIQALMTG